jgi:2-dehydro-3-deoxyphosphogluconate aldolase/(4S)-4-hydroxy-2-oxoglutarate aldolase
MDKKTIARMIVSCGLVPIVRFDCFDDVVPIVEALLAGGVTTVEFPMTSPLALAAIETVADKFGDRMIVGAGTVLTMETAHNCFSAGAQFIVSPVVNVDVIGLCSRNDVVSCPGALTPTEVLLAWDAGADFIKIFPCDRVGGAAYIRALKVPLPHINMIPVGGVTVDNAAEFINAGSCALGTGAGLIDKADIAVSRYDSITEKAACFISVIRNTRNDSRE